MNIMLFDKGKGFFIPECKNALKLVQDNFPNLTMYELRGHFEQNISEISNAEILITHCSDDDWNRFLGISKKNSVLIRVSSAAANRDKPQISNESSLVLYLQNSTREIKSEDWKEIICFLANLIEDCGITSELEQLEDKETINRFFVPRNIKYFGLLTLLCKGFLIDFYKSNPDSIVNNNILKVLIDEGVLSTEDGHEPCFEIPEFTDYDFMGEDYWLAPFNIDRAELLSCLKEELFKFFGRDDAVFASVESIILQKIKSPSELALKASEIIRRVSAV